MAAGPAGADTEEAMRAPERPRIAVYVQHYLTGSMTFIHRQLLGVQAAYEPIVLTPVVENLEQFPFARILHAPSGGVRKLAMRAYIKLSGRTYYGGYWRTRYWRREAATRGIRLIHAHFGPGGLEALPVARALAIPLLVTFHGYDASSLLRSRSYVRRLRKLARYARFIAVANAVAERLKAVLGPELRIDTHYIGVPVDDFPLVKRVPRREKLARKERLNFLQVSNFVEKKGHRYTIEAFREFVETHPDAELVLAGDGPLLPAMKRLAEERGLAGRVRFPGRLHPGQVFALMKDADLFVHHSVCGSDGNQEGIPTVLMEAMSTGLVPVTTRHSGIPELIQDGVNGFLAPERDVATFAQKMRAAAEADDSMANSAAATVREKFNIQVQNTRLQEIYRRVIDGHSTGC